MQINTSTTTFPSCCGEAQILVTQWVPAEGEIRGVVQISHGVASRGATYDSFAKTLCTYGYAVAANDHLGHGASQIPGSPRFYFGERDDWWHVVEDMECLRRQLVQKFPGIPIFLFGHSMGSFLSRSHMIRYPGAFDGVILSATAHPGKGMLLAGRVMIDRELRRVGPQGSSAKIGQLVFGNSPAHESTGDDALQGLLCGGKITVGLFRDMLDGLTFITQRKNIAKVDGNCPIFLLSGSCDPVGERGKGVERAFRSYQAAGVRDVRRKLYPGLHHEILRENAEDPVTEDIICWLEEHLPREGESETKERAR